KMSEEELIITNLIVNRQRGKSNPADEAKIVKLLVDDYKYSFSVVAEKLNISQSTVEKYYQIAKGSSERLLEALKHGSISVGCAYYLSMIDDKNLQNQVLEYAMRWGYTVEQCKSAALSVTIPQFTPPPGGWSINLTTGEPVRVKMKTALCGMEEDPGLVVNIPVPLKYSDVVRTILSDPEVCKNIVEMSGAEEEIPSPPQTPPQKTEEKKTIQWEW
ncbi:MAG: hypothetical protein QXF50_01640, partial [Sulfolobales archaeon]